MRPLVKSIGRPRQASWVLGELTLNLTDAAGNVRDQAITINVIEQPKVRISLNAVNMSGQPITTIATGQEFKVRVVVTDLRTGSEIPNSPTGGLCHLCGSAVRLGYYRTDRYQPN